MDEDDDPDVTVKYLVACSRVTIPYAYPGNPYSLHDIRYTLDVPPDREWPVRLDELWLFVRFYSGTGTKRFTLAVLWLDAPTADSQEVAYFDRVVAFRPGEPVHDRVWDVSYVRYPGAGRYMFQLIDDSTETVLADECINIRRRDETEAKV